MSGDQRSYSVLMATAGDRNEAARIARILVERGQAACVQLLPIESYYMWKGKVETGSELLMLAKTRSDLVDAAIATIKSEHSYETPEIIAIPMTAGLPAYLDWIDEVTQ